MIWTDLLAEANAQNSHSQKIQGVVIGLVTNNQDPEQLGRVKVKFPWLSDLDESHWARIATPMAGKTGSFYCLPEVDDEVLVVFEQGDPRFPYILGVLWNGQDNPPDTNENKKNDVRLIRSRSGHEIRLNDAQGEEKLEIIDKNGKNKLTFDTTSNTITITSDRDITLSAPNGKIKLSAQAVKLESTEKITLASQKDIDIKTNTEINLSGSLINLN
jgi:uncharacterized protein involved in type VI secretion and phage assembly